MASADEGTPKSAKRIEIQLDGPYRVEGGIPLVRKIQVISEFEEPLTWKKEGDVPTSGTYDLCRCGHSHDKPFCDSTHFEIGFDGTETADTQPSTERQETYPGGTGIVVRRDHSLCMESGFCANRKTKIRLMVKDSADPQVRAQIMAMVGNCPSSSYTFALEAGQPDIEPDLPEQIAVTTEICSEGPIQSALWVTGSIPIERADGEPFEIRNRVTLCCCGRSKNKPLCDGAHRFSE
jgi:CDGSH-type Zn-finger protein